MKTLSILTAMALAAAMLAPTSARADKEGRALIGGIIGGIIIASALDDDCDTRVEVGYHSRSDHGYWEWRTVKRWVPGYYERRRDHCGNRYKVWVSGHYTFVKEKVWVSGYSRSWRNDRHHGHYDRHDDHYGHDRRDNDHRRDHDDRDRNRDRDRDDDRRDRGNNSDYRRHADNSNNAQPAVVDRF